MKTRTGHPIRSGKQQELRERMWEVFNWIDRDPAMIEELFDCIKDEQLILSVPGKLPNLRSRSTAVALAESIVGSTDEARLEGHEEGKEKGYDEGWDEGKDEGHSDGYTEGYDTGHEEGHKEGYDEAEAEHADS